MNAFLVTFGSKLPYIPWLLNGLLKPHTSQFNAKPGGQKSPHQSLISASVLGILLHLHHSHTPTDTHARAHGRFGLDSPVQ